MKDLLTKYPDLLDSIQKTSEYLSKLLEKPDFQLHLLRSNDENVLHDYRSQWTGNTSEDSSNWGHYLDEIGTIASKFIVAAYDGKTLTGLCLYDTENNHVPDNSVTIQTIEGKQTGNPIKGLTASIFCQAALSVAQDINADNLCIIKPVDSTRPAYQRALAFKNEGRHLITPVQNSRTVNWNEVFARQKEKSRYSPTGF